MAKTYYDGTFEEHQLLIHSSGPVANFSRSACRDAFRRLLDTCDGDGDENPLNWKTGGEYIKGGITYQLNMKGRALKRQWPPPAKLGGICMADSWPLIMDRFIIAGYGWATTDDGKSIADAAKGCFGAGLTGWNMKYFSEADGSGFEWAVYFQGPWLSNSYCFNNGNVQDKLGVKTNGCHLDWDDLVY